MQKRQKILVSDFHIGLNLAQMATLERIGTDCRLLTLSATPDQFDLKKTALSDDEKKAVYYIKDLFHDKYRDYYRKIKDKITSVSKAGPHPAWFGLSWTPAKTERFFKIMGEAALSRVFSSYDTYLVSFPASLAHLFLALAQKYDARLVLNLGHRFNIGLASLRENKAMISMLRNLHESPRHILAAGSEYDCKYVEYYLGFKPTSLPIACNHLDLKLQQPESETMLIGPVNYTEINTEIQLNSISKCWAGDNKSEPITLSLVRTLYPRYRYDELRVHPAVVVYPYSIYSVSTLEFYELNIPLFVPSPEFIVTNDIMNDRVLYPIYCTEKQYHKMKTEAQIDSPYSPNTYEYDAQKYWIEYSFIYQAKNTVIWKSEEDLMEKLHCTDLNRIRSAMYTENEQRRSSANRVWMSTLGN